MQIHVLDTLPNDLQPFLFYSVFSLFIHTTSQKILASNRNWSYSVQNGDYSTCSIMCCMLLCFMQLANGHVMVVGG